MNKDNAKDYLPLIQALADGKTIQSKLSSRETFKDSPKDILFGNPPDWYRIKPEPLEYWFPIWKGDNNRTWDTVYRSKEQLLSSCDKDELERAALFIEVIE